MTRVSQKVLTIKAIKGDFTPLALIERLLVGSGLKLIKRADASYTLSSADNSTHMGTLATAIVQGNSKTESTGSYTFNRVSIGKGAQSLRDIPQSVSIVTRQRLNDQNITSLPEAMKQVTGITVTKYDGAGFFNSFNARGYAAGTFQLDGVNVQSNANMADTDLGNYG